MSCQTSIPYGNNGKECLYSEILNIGIFDPDTTFTETTVKSIVAWKALVNVSLGGFVAGGLTSYTNTTDDPNIITAANTGVKTVTNFPAVSYTAYVSTNHCDYSEMMEGLKGQVYGIVYFLKDGSYIMNYEDGLYKPFEAKVNAVGKLIGDDLNNSFPIFVSHIDSEALRSAVIVSSPPTINIGNVIKKAMPSGATLKVTTDYVIATGVVVVKLTERCSSTAITGALVGNFSIEETNDLDTPAVTSATPVSGKDGYYSLVLNIESTPIPMVAGNWMLIAYKDTTGTVVNTISNRELVLAES